MDPTGTAIVVSIQKTPTALENGESRTAVAMGRKWTLWPESGMSVGTAILYIFATLFNLALLGAWIAGAVLVSNNKHYTNDSEKTKYQVGLGLLIGGLCCWCCCSVGVVAHKNVKI